MPARRSNGNACRDTAPQEPVRRARVQGSQASAIVFASRTGKGSTGAAASELPRTGYSIVAGPLPGRPRNVAQGATHDRTTIPPRRESTCHDGSPSHSRAMSEACRTRPGAGHWVCAGGWKNRGAKGRRWIVCRRASRLHAVAAGQGNGTGVRNVRPSGPRPRLLECHAPPGSPSSPIAAWRRRGGMRASAVSPERFE